MTNEQLGREWCGRNGKSPEIIDPWYGSHLRYVWHQSVSYTRAYPQPKSSVLSYHLLGNDLHSYDTEVEAYAAVGAALREVERLGAEVRGILGVEPLAEEHDTEWVVVPMPLNADGQGPETDPALVARTEWHVWTHDCIAVAVARSEAVAKHIVDLHNREASR